MKPRKRGQLFEISYRCPGHKQPFFERFTTLEEANLRCAQITYEKSIGQFRAPVTAIANVVPVRKKTAVTVGELMDEYVQLYGLNNSYLSYSQHRIDLSLIWVMLRSRT